jgi:cytochrome oxidase Cu insertion factor (SCO1/SenC/PrrC family)
MPNMPKRQLKLTARTGIIIISVFLGVIFFTAKGQSAGVKPVATPAPPNLPMHIQIPAPNTSPAPLLRYPQIGGDFTLTNTEGQQQSFNSLKDTLILLTFGFTACTHTCPMILAKLSRLRHELSLEQQKKVRIVFVNVDPKVTLPDFKKYLSIFEPKDATDAGIVGFTGTQEDLQKVAKQYGATFFENSNTSQPIANHQPIANTETTTEQALPHAKHTTQKVDAITHTDRIFLLDTTQTIRKIYPKEANAKEIIEDIQSLIKENSLVSAH